MKKAIIILIIIYFSVGLAMATYSYIDDLKTFECLNPDTLHGYITRGSGLFSNPDPNFCIRRGFKLQSIKNIPTLIIFGAPLLAAKYYGAILKYSVNN